MLPTHRSDLYDNDKGLRGNKGLFSLLRSFQFPRPKRVLMLFVLLSCFYLAFSHLNATSSSSSSSTIDSVGLTSGDSPGFNAENNQRKRDQIISEDNEKDSLFNSQKVGPVDIRNRDNHGRNEDKKPGPLDLNPNRNNHLQREKERPTPREKHNKLPENIGIRDHLADRQRRIQKEEQGIKEVEDGPVINVDNNKNDGDNHNSLLIDDNSILEQNEVIQSDEEQQTPTHFITEWPEQKQRVIEAFLHAWKGYKDYAWGKDELHPISKRGSDWFGLGLTLVDSLDLMLMMNLKEEYEEAREWVRTSMTYKSGESNLFELTIRVLGGFLSAYHLSGKDELYLKKAKDLGDRLMEAFSSGTPIPYASVDLLYRRGIPASHDGGDSSTAEVSTIQLEFTALSRLTSDPKYATAADNVIRHFKTLHRDHGLVPIYINPKTGHFSGSVIRLGSRGDSYYEYLLKQWLHTNRTEAWHKEMYDEAVDGIRRKLLGRSEPNKLLFVNELISGNLSPKMDHLVCFLPGVLALGVTLGKPEHVANTFMTEDEKKILEIAKELTFTCYQMYAQMAIKLAPEIVYFNTDPSQTKDLYVKPLDRHNLLRPETVESIFILYRITGDVKYRQWGREIFDAFEQYTKIPSGGYSSLNDVTDLSAPKRDKMESFFLGETLKYLYLLFCDDAVIPLDKYVFNTEAHPLPILPN